MLRVITCNVNGIRAAARKGFYPWLAAQQADVVCLQETKAQTQQLTDPLFNPLGYYCYYHDAERKGYSGVALYSRRAPDTVRIGLGLPYVDSEGRYLEARFGNLRIVSLYLHSGSAGPLRQALKFRFLEDFLPHLQALQQAPGDTILCGDWNIAHRPLDLKNWRANQKNSGFLPEERAWLDTVFGPVGLHDAFRVLYPDTEQYTWWSNRGRAWENNVGWRIDYQIITSGLRERVQAAQVYTAERFSDHAPLIVDYAWP